jgi:DNA end-binding protein Ku
MARPIWSGSITLGLVVVPVRLFTAVRDKTVHFHQLHDKDGVRLKQKRICPEDGEEVSIDHVIRGYEVSKDHFVTLSDDELDALDPKGGKSIEIERFVDQAEIDPIYYDRVYYLAPAEGVERPYALLREALAQSSKVAIGRVILHTKQYLAAVRPFDRALALATMHFPDEVIPIADVEELAFSVAKLKPQELALARQLIGALEGKFEPGEYEDEHRKRVLELIDKKAAGEEIVVQPQAAAAGQIVDLMEALEASLAQAKTDGASSKPAADKPKKRRRAA